MSPPQAKVTRDMRFLRSLAVVLILLLATALAVAFLLRDRVPAERTITGQAQGQAQP